MVLEVIEGSLRTAQSISEFGLMVVICAFFVVLSALMMIAMFRWQMNTIDSVMKTNKEMLSKLDKQMTENNKIMQSIAEGLIPKTMLEIKNTSSMAFDLAKHRLLELINTVLEENHIADREQTEEKIKNLVTNLHEDMKSKFDCYSYRGRKLSQYTNQEWIGWMISNVVLEIYNKNGMSKDRTYTSVSATFDRIKLDFYHRINEV
jgi:membrane-associated HD superfamily phosphohydrolase